MSGAATSSARAAAMALLMTIVAVSAKAQPPQRVRVLIGFSNQPGPAEEALVHAAGGRVHHRFHLVKALAVSVPVTALEGLRRNPRVSLIEADAQVQAFDVELDNTWGVTRIGAGIVHAGGNLGQGVKVAVLDTGIDCTHPDLDGNCAGGIDFVNDDGDPSDDHGHGTHVAGTIAAEDNGTGVVGVAPKALLYAVKTMAANGSGYFSDAIAGVEWAVDNGIQVTNHSYGSATDPGSIARAAFDNARAAGVVHVAAAGNSGACPPTGDTVIYPAKFASVIAVAAVSSSNARACFSSTGPKVDVAAPGVSINSTLRGGGYGTKSGTSMASPHGAGLAALIIASGITSPAEIRQRMIGTADDLGAAGKDDLYGYGLIDADGAVASGPVNTAPVVTISAPVTGSKYASGASISFRGSATDSEDGALTSALSWRSNLDGVIGNGGSFVAVLRNGSHTISASATDSGGRTSTRSVSVTVGSTSTTVKVKSIGYRKYGGKNASLHLEIVSTVVDGSGRAVAGAQVTLSVANGSASRVFSAVTDATGRAVVTWKQSPAGCYKSTVQSVSGAGIVWDKLTPTNSFCK